MSKEVNTQPANWERTKHGKNEAEEQGYMNTHTRLMSQPHHSVEGHSGRRGSKEEMLLFKHYLYFLSKQNTVVSTFKIEN